MKKTLIKILPALLTFSICSTLHAAESENFECTVQSSNGRTFSYNIGSIISKPKSSFIISDDEKTYVFSQARPGESLVIYRDSGKFFWVVGASNSRFSRNIPAEMAGVCELKKEKLKF